MAEKSALEEIREIVELQDSLGYTIYTVDGGNEVDSTCMELNKTKK